MTLPVNIRINVRAPFPARVVGAGFVVVSKVNGIWTISVDYTQLAPLLISADIQGALVAVYDPATKQYNTLTVAQVIATGINTYRVVTAAGPVTIGPSDVTILLNKTAPAATNINLPASASRNGVPVTVKDYGGVAQANNITFVPAAGETIDGFTASQAAANGAALINVNYGKKTLFPLTSGGWYL